MACTVLSGIENIVRVLGACTVSGEFWGDMQSVLGVYWVCRVLAENSRNVYRVLRGCRWNM